MIIKRDNMKLDVILYQPFQLKFSSFETLKESTSTTKIGATQIQHLQKLKFVQLALLAQHMCDIFQCSSELYLP